MENKIGLVLEGGGMRGVYTGGVLDYFMDQGIYFPYVIGVSMGACNGASYISRQRGRNKKVVVDYIEDKRYISLKGLVKNRSLFGMKFIFDEIPNKLCPFDYETFKKSNQEFIIVATDCDTGKPIYFKKDECEDIIKIIMASSSLPFVSKKVEAQGKTLLDGGISDSIPVQKALDDGCEKLVVVLTRNKGYVKKPFKFKRIANRVYKDNKKLVKAIINRYRVYNETLEYVEKLEKEGKAFIIRPEEELKVDRVEKNPHKLEYLYDKGYEEIKNRSEELKAFLK